MAEKDKLQQQPDKGKIIEKGQKSGRLNDSRLPDFRFTPPPPPPPPPPSKTVNNSKDGE